MCRETTVIVPSRTPLLFTSALIAGVRSSTVMSCTGGPGLEVFTTCSWYTLTGTISVGLSSSHADTSALLVVQRSSLQEPATEALCRTIAGIALPGRKLYPMKASTCPRTHSTAAAAISDIRRTFRIHIVRGRLAGFT